MSHMIFSGRGRLPGNTSDELFQNYIKLSSTAFWDAYLKGDTTAKNWLKNGGFEKVLGKDGTFEKKSP